ncbi:MAG: transcriptional regulator [Candidatus Delongbacteria bacterium GWF2_40_14]|nr:MAG: transcriptional regulator [Candidatus Delongbacteria bacterium GWF2_40_14]
MKPTASELDILQILWQNGNMTVKEINEEINKVKETGYTTTLKLMQIMHEKGLLSREQNGRSHVYKASIKEDDTKSSLLKNFIQSTFNGSTANLVMQALGDHKTTREELEMIRELLNDIEKGKK